MTETNMRELDAWIAEHVMEWQWWRFDAPPVGGSKSNKRDKWCQLVPPDEKWPETHKVWRGVKCGCCIAKIPNYTDLGLFKPSTNAASAMAVIKKCESKCDMPIEIDRKRSHDGPWRVETGVLSQGIIGIAPTLELAICLFAKNLFTKDFTKRI